MLRKLLKRIPLPANLYYWILRKISKCKTCFDGELFPQYGLAPHAHDLTITGSLIGSTVIEKDKSKYPDFYDDVDNGAGVWYCSNKECTNSKENKKE